MYGFFSSKSWGAWLCIGLLLGGLGSFSQAQKMDLDKPEDVMKAYRKLFASTKDGEPATYFWQGNIYGHIPGKRDQLLFSYVAMNVRATTGLHDAEKGAGYKLTSREILFYMDPKTGEIIDTWKNPWTGEEVEVVHVANDPVNHTNYAKGRFGPTTWRGHFKNGTGWLSFEVPLLYPNPLGGAYQDYVGGNYQAMEMFNFIFDEAEMMDASRASCDKVAISWARFSQWLPWMKMGNIAGEMIYNGTGVKMKHWDELPEVMKARIRKDHPAFTSPPPADDSRRNKTSWSVFKEHIDAKRKAEQQ